MKITAPAMMLATTLLLVNQECVSQSYTIDANDLIYKDDINFIGLHQYQRINNQPGTMLENQDFRQISTVKYNNQNLMTIQWLDKAKGNIIEIEKVDLHYVIGQNIHINLVIPGALDQRN